MSEARDTKRDKNSIFPIELLVSLIVTNEKSYCCYKNCVINVVYLAIGWRKLEVTLGKKRPAVSIFPPFALSPLIG